MSFVDGLTQTSMGSTAPLNAAPLVNGSNLNNQPISAAHFSDPLSVLEDTFIRNLDPGKALKDPVTAMLTATQTWTGKIALMPDIVREATYPTPFAVSPLLPLLLLSLASQKHTPDTKTSFRSEYDFIVVGAGSAGSVVASRISENECVTVLLLEAGKSPPLLTEVPAISGVFAMTDIDWQYKSVPQKHAAYGIKDRKVPWPKGKAIGGTGVVNGMLYFRGNHKNYDEWAANGATGWSWKDVYPYFLKLENNTDQDIADNGYHATGGPVSVERFRWDSVFKNASSEVAQELGHKFHDVNGASQIGFSDLQGDLRNGQRCSTAKAYLVPAENRTNLDIVAEAFVTKILIRCKRATGVEFDYKGSSYQVKARKEVIVSAGSVNTPKLLMLSGIGPRKTLEKHGIPVISDLPVGENFHDHVGSIFNFVVRSDIPPYLVQLVNPLNTWKYINERSGPLATSGSIFSIPLLTNSGDKDPSAIPDQELYFLEGVQLAALPRMNFDLTTYLQLYGPYEASTTLWCISHSLHPRSRGSVSINSNDPYDPPLIDPNYYEDSQDLEDVVAGLKNCMTMAKTKVMAKFETRPFETLMRGCEELAGDEDEYLRCYARHFVFAPCHDVGTAKMGNPLDNTTVVDPELRVKGIQRLRVVDASIMPNVPTGNTYNPVIMVGEKASDMIKKTYPCSFKKCCNKNRKKKSSSN